MTFDGTVMGRFKVFAGETFRRSDHFRPFYCGGADAPVPVAGTVTAGSGKVHGPGISPIAN